MLKNSYTTTVFLKITYVLTAGVSFAFCQPVTLKNKSNSQFTIDNPGQTDVFVKNFGQFDNLLRSTEVNASKKVSYVINSTDQVFFTPQGYIWKLSKIEKEESEKTSGIEPKENEEKEENRKVATYFINMNWEGANPDAQLIAEEEVGGYYTYANEVYRNLKAKGYKKLIYKDLYPGIDVEYIIPKNKGGIKYSLIIKSGADITKVKMHYSGDIEKTELDEEGSLIIKTATGNMIDHNPKSFYEENNVAVLSFFELNKNTVTFKLPDHKKQPAYDMASADRQETLVIDPWTIVPNLFTGSGPYDVDYDKYGNIYIDFAVGTSSHISKYSPTGVFLWTINMASSLGSNYSDFCVIPSGSIFIASGAGYNLCKISSAGILLSTVSWPPNLNAEGWVVSYNQCLNTLLVGGGGISFPICLRMGMDTALTGAFTGNAFNGATGTNNDIARMLIDDNGDMYSYFNSFNNRAGTENTIFKSLPPYSTFSFSILRSSCAFSEAFSIPVTGNRVSNRLNVMAVNSYYLYFFDGRNLEARSKTTGALISSIVVSASYLCGSSYTNEGIAVDECNNVYIGGKNLVHVFNFNGSTFTILPTMAVPGNVYDIMLDKAKQLIYVTGVGFLNSLTALPSCNLLSAIPGPCTGDGSATITAVGGTPPYTYRWSNGATTNTITAPVGTYTVTVTDGSCNNPISIDTVVSISNTGGITLNLTGTTTICNGSSTTLTASGGITYSWNTGATTATITVSPSSTTTYTIVATDANSCSATATITVIPSPPLTTQYIKGTANCTGCGCKEWIMVTASGGTSPYSYSWPDGYVNRYKNQLCPGAYTIKVIDTNGCNTNLIVNAP